MGKEAKTTKKYDFHLQAMHNPFGNATLEHNGTVILMSDDIQLHVEWG